MAEATAPQFTSRVTKQGASFDALAKEAYGDQNYVRDLINDNPQLAAEMQIPAGETIFFRLLENPTTGELMPIWLSDDEETGTDDTTNPPPIPVVDGPVVNLGFSEGYPKVDENKISFAINKSLFKPFTVEKQAGSIIFQSPGYPFSAGFPVTTAEIPDGGIYYVKVGDLVSGPLTIIGAGNTLAFKNAPIFFPVGAVLNIKYAINVSGAFSVKLTRKTGNVVVYNQMVTHTADVDVILPVSAQDKYTVQVGPLSYEVEVLIASEVTTAPDWLNYVGLSYSRTRDCSIWVGADEDVELLLERVDGAAMSGITWGNAPWSNSAYVPGTSEFVVSPYTEVFRMNPLGVNTGGVVPNVRHRLKIRRTLTPSQVFVFEFTSPVSDQLSPVNFTIAEPTMAACKRGPFIVGDLVVSDTRISLLFDADQVYVFKWRIRKESDMSLKRSGSQAMTNTDGSSKFNPGNRPFVVFDQLPPDDYVFELEGESCDSSAYVQTRDFTIAEETPGPDPIEGDITPKSVVHGLPQTMVITVSGSSEDWVLNDTGSEVAPQPGFTNWYQIGSHWFPTGNANLTNYHYESNAPVRILKARVRNDLDTLVGWDPYDWQNNHGGGFDKNNSYAICIILFNEIE